MMRPDALDDLRRAGARRRAIDDGTLPPDEPAGDDATARSVAAGAPTAVAGTIGIATAAGAAAGSASSGAHAPDASAPQAPVPGAPHTLPQTAPDPVADGSGVPAWGGLFSGSDTPVGAPVASGPWFDARAFFLGWLAMVIVAFAGAPSVLIAAAGFGAAYLLARRGKLKNALLSVGLGVVAVIVLLAGVLVIGLVASA